MISLRSFCRHTSRQKLARHKALRHFCRSSAGKNPRKSMHVFNRGLGCIRKSSKRPKPAIFALNFVKFPCNTPSIPAKICRVRHKNRSALGIPLIPGYTLVSVENLQARRESLIPALPVNSQFSIDNCLVISLLSRTIIRFSRRLI